MRLTKKRCLAISEKLNGQPIGKATYHLLPPDVRSDAMRNRVFRGLLNLNLATDDRQIRAARRIFRSLTEREIRMQHPINRNWIRSFRKNVKRGGRHGQA